MKPLLIFLLIFTLQTNLQAQSDEYGMDTVFIRKNTGWIDDTLNYTTDTVLFGSGMRRNMLVGTTILPSYNNIEAYAYGLHFSRVSKSDCMNDGEKTGDEPGKINSVRYTDSSLSVDINISANCCHDFLCEVSVDSLGTVNLLYTGYGPLCGCTCCFGLVYDFELIETEDSRKITAVMINGDRTTLVPIAEKR